MDSSAPAAFAAKSAWEPLPAEQWNEDQARHLLRRAGWSAQPATVARAVQEGLPRTLDRLFPARPVDFPKPKLIERYEADFPDYTRRSARAAPGPERQMVQREWRERSQQAVGDLSIKWLQFALAEEHSAQEKWVLFLSNVYVVSHEKVRNAALIQDHFAILRRHAFGPAPALTKAVTRSPAMILYLDLQQSKREAPNENFARELFELFVLGEGHYSEQDIKQAARAFTGYRQQAGQFRFFDRQHDSGPKLIFGQKGRFAGDDVVDLAYTRPAAARHLPREMSLFYLSERALPDAYYHELGAWWQRTGYDLRQLTQRFFGSRLFYAPEFRGNFIKSPAQFYLGLLQDLDLNVAPLPRQVLNAMRQMGQILFQPPNVRGWVGGRLWINSATLGARRQLVQTLFTPLNEATLNADEQVEIVAARARGVSNFTVADQRLREFAALDDDQLTQRFADYFLPGAAEGSLREDLKAFLAAESAANRRLARVRNAAITLLQSPEYQLC